MNDYLCLAIKVVKMGLTLCVFIATSPLANAARIHKCVDNNGRVILTDNPPPDARCDDWGAYKVPPVRSDMEDRKSKKIYSGARVSLNLFEADIKMVFNMLSQQGNVTIVSGDDITGSVTLKMMNVPWDEALDKILDLKGLDKMQEGKIITVISSEKKRSLERAWERWKKTQK